MQPFQALVTYINRCLSPIVYSIFIALVIFFSYYSFVLERKSIYEQIDHQLLAIAKGLPLLLPRDFHDRAVSSDSISEEEFQANMSHFRQISQNFKVDYVYTAVEHNGTIYITSSNATDEELRTGINLVRYFDPYTEATPPMLEIFQSGKILFVENTDRWGTFRNVLVPLKSPNGTTYISGVSISLNHIRTHLRERSVHHFVFGIGLILISLPVFLWRHRKMTKLAFNDPLTQLPNRLAFQSLANASLHLCKRNHTPFALMFLDLDGFKMINDTLGHSIGDKLLIKVSRRLDGVLRKSDIPSRQGGDEFVIALPDTDLSGASFVAEKILNEIAKPYRVDQHTLSVTFSIGIAMFPDDGGDLENLSKKADIAMYEAKKAGRNCFRCSAR